MSWWKIWEKARLVKRAEELDISTAAGLPMWLLFEKQEPFTFLFNDQIFEDLVPDAANLSEEVRAFVRFFAVGYQLIVYLKLVERKFGSEVARLMQEHQQIIGDRAPTLQIAPLLRSASQAVEQVEESAIADSMPFEYCLALTALLLSPSSPHFVPPERRDAAETLTPSDGSLRSFASLLRKSKANALRVFEPLVALLELAPQEIKNLRNSGAKPTRLFDQSKPYWSDAPGCFERQLQRQFQNPLFPQELRDVAQDQIDEAKARDNSEHMALLVIMRSVIEVTRECPHPLGFSEFNSIREQVGDLLERTSDLGASADGERSQLIAVFEALATDLMRSVTELWTNADEALPVVTEALEVSRLRFRTLAPPMGQFLRSDTPIVPEVLIPSLLTEDEEFISRYSLILDVDTRQSVHNAAREILTRAIAEGYPRERAEAKLRALSGSAHA